MRIRGFLSRHRTDLLAIAILILGVSLFHSRGLRPGQTFLPVDLSRNYLPWWTEWVAQQNWLISDPLLEFYPFLATSVNTIRQTGTWPLWDPAIFLGHPVIADPLFQPFYPVFKVLGLALGAARGLAIGLWLHVILASVLTYGFLRTIGCNRRASVLGAFTYALSGYLVTWFESTFRVTTLVWLPGVLWAFELAVRRHSLRYAALAALALSLAILGGHFMILVTFCLFFGLYALGRTIESGRSGARLMVWPLVVLVITIACGALMGAIQIMPFSEYLSLSQRVSSQGLADPLPWQQFITLVIPNFFGNPAAIGPYWGELNFSESTIYAGLLALLLAITTVLSSRRFFVVYLALVGMAAIYFLLGGPGVRLAGSLPVLRDLSLHRSTFILPMIVAFIAAMGLNEPRLRPGAVLLAGAILVLAVGIVSYRTLPAVQEHWSQLRPFFLQAAMLLAVATALILLRAWRPETRPVVDSALVGLVFIDLFLFGSRFSPAGPIAELTPITPVIEYLKGSANPRLQRVMTLQLDKVVFGPNVLSLFGIPEPGGYSSLLPARLRQLTTAADPEISIGWMSGNRNMVVFSHPPRRLLDLLSVGQVVSEFPMDDPGVRAEFVADGCSGDRGEISTARPLSGSFTVRDTAINRLDLRFRLHQPADGALIVRLWRGADRTTLILESRQDLESIGDVRPLSLYFAPEREAPGQIYTWEVVADTPSGHTGVALCTDEKGTPAISVYGADGFQSYKGEVYVFERFSPVPRAYVAYAAEHIPDDAAATTRLLDEAFDLRNIVVTAEALDLPTTPKVSASRAEVTEYENERVVVKAAAVERGILVLNDQFHPGWRAYVDGRPAPVLRVNQIMRGVVLPPGEHEVKFEFAPRSLAIGGGLAAAGLLLLVFLCLIDRHPKVARWLRP
jgi:hypothetical protein